MTFLANFAKAYFKPLGLLRLVPFVLVIPIIVFHALSLTGCVSTSPAIPNIYIVSLRSSANTTGIPLQVRIGYFGICGIDADGTRCQPSTGHSADSLATTLFPAPSGTNTTSSKNTTTATPETTNLITTALALQSGTFISVLAAAGVLFLLGLVALVLLKRDAQSQSAWEHPRRSAIIRRATYGLLLGSTALAFAAALATSQAAGALQYASTAAVLIHEGRTLQVLQWVGFGFQVLFVAAVPVLMRARGGEAEGEFKEEQV